jgi:hypothetical protein
MCSLFSADQGEDPIGTAGEWGTYLLLELPLPWAHDTWKSERLAPELTALVADAQKAHPGLRPLALQPDPEYSLPGRTRIFLYTRPSGPFALYRKREYVVPSAELVSYLRALLDGLGGEVDLLASYREEDESVREMLVCTHGTRDACCGKFGYRVYSLLRHVHAPRMEGKMRVWRVSHLGGHRFAPNLLDFPDGRYWGRLDDRSVEALLHRAELPGDISRHYRGWSGLDPLCQVVEREVFAREGWPWALVPKSGTVLEWEGGTAKVRIDYTNPESGEPGAYTATVATGGTVHMNTCLRDEPLREVPQYRVVELDRVG